MKRGTYKSEAPTQKAAPKPSVGVIYLARGAHALSDFQAFVRSYRAHPAGMDHDLVVLLKGMDKSGARAASIALFRSIGARIIEIDDYGYDIHAYLRAVQHLDHDYILFCNTYTELLTSDWLAKLYTHASRPEVGMVGTTATFESLNDSIRFISKIIWLGAVRAPRYDHRLASYYAHWLNVHAPNWMNAHASLGTRFKRMLEDNREKRPRYDDPSLEPGFDIHWNAVTANPPLKQYLDFPPFPNPHIRSTGFMMRRELLRGFGYDLKPTKEACVAFENGPGSLTRRVRALGLATLLVGADGVAYDVPDWPKSRTFRLGDQGNLVSSDNQVRNFTAFKAAERSIHERITWGDYIGPADKDFIPLGFAFARNDEAAPPTLRQSQRSPGQVAA